MRILYIITLLVGLSISQERSVIFNTGSPDSTVGYIIDSTHMVADRIYVQNNYVLEAMVFYMSLQSSEGNVIVSIREDNNGVPGELVSDLSEWDFELNPLNPSDYNLIVTTDLCIYLEANNYYWWHIKAADNTTEATWIQSNGVFYTRAISNDSGDTWETGIGPAGAGGVWAEEIEGSIRIAESMQMAVTPVFLLAGVGLILSVLGVRLGRIKDRMRVLQQALVNIEGEGKEVLEDERNKLTNRSKLIYTSICSCAASALFVCFVIVSLFVGNLYEKDFSLLIAILFITCMVLLIISLIFFVFEVFISTRSIHRRLVDSESVLASKTKP